MGLNDTLKSYYSLPGLKEVFAQLSKDWIFTKIKLSGAYLQTEVNEECSKLLMINTH